MIANHRTIADANQVGSLDWLKATGGSLSRKQRVQAIARTLGAAPANAYHLANVWLWWRWRPSSEVTEDDWPQAPRSQFAREAEQTSRQVLSEAFFNHSMRTWLFGSVLAAADGIDLNAEGSDLFFVAAMLHDVGFGCPTYKRCFTHGGVNKAWALASPSGCPASDAEQVASAISHHITPGLREKDGGRLAMYIQKASLLDLTGIRAAKLPKSFVCDVFREYPAVDIRHEARARWRAETAIVPSGRAQVTERWGRLSFWVRTSPLPPPCRENSGVRRGS